MTHEIKKKKEFCNCYDRSLGSESQATNQCLILNEVSNPAYFSPQILSPERYDYLNSNYT